jgi:hypothetical protein
MKYAIELGSGAMMYITDFIMIDSEFDKGIRRHTDSMVIA